MTFKKNKYMVVRNALSHEMSEFLYNYLLFKRNFYHYVKTNKEFFGNLPLGANQDIQVKESYCVYGSIGLDILLDKIKPTTYGSIKMSKLQYINDVQLSNKNSFRWSICM